MASVVDLTEMVVKLSADAVQQYEEWTRQFVLKFKVFNKEIKHFHSSHWHPCCHSYQGQTINRNYGDPYFHNCKVHCYSTGHYPEMYHKYDLNSLVLAMYREYTKCLDIDNNGLIFGTNFIFSMDDSNVPVTLKIIQRLLVNNITLKRYTLNQFLSTLPSNTYVYKQIKT